MASHKGGRVGKPRILIAGAGIGGLVAALALVQRGFEVELYEQAADLREVGAGLSDLPQRSRVLRASVEPAMAGNRLGADVQGNAAVQHRPGRGGCKTRRQRERAVRFTVLARASRRFPSGAGLGAGERAPGAVHVGRPLHRLEQGADGVTLSLENGGRVNGDALIGADGVHSWVRETLFGTGRATFTGFVAWRGGRVDGSAPDATPSAARQRRAGPARMVTS